MNVGGDIRVPKVRNAILKQCRSGILLMDPDLPEWEMWITRRSMKAGSKAWHKLMHWMAIQHTSN